MRSSCSSIDVCARHQPYQPLLALVACTVDGLRAREEGFLAILRMVLARACFSQEVIQTVGADLVYVGVCRRTIASGYARVN